MAASSATTSPTASPTSSPAATASSGSPAASPSPSAAEGAGGTPIAYCVEQAQQDAGGVTFKRAYGVDVPGLILGTGERGIVLSNMAGDDLCSWLAYAPELAGAGSRVALFNYSGTENHEDVIAAAAMLRERGATKVVLMGASAGGTTVVQAGAKLSPPPAAVVSLSPQDSTDGRTSAKSLTAPTLYVSAEMDAGNVDATKALHAATAGKDKILKIVPDAAHGTALLLSDPLKAEIYAFIDTRTK
ncbi:MAG: hypothetical protein ABIS44_05705 [Mycobacteriales bacterium]